MNVQVWGTVLTRGGRGLGGGPWSADLGGGLEPAGLRRAHGCACGPLTPDATLTSPQHPTTLTHPVHPNLWLTLAHKSMTEVTHTSQIYV